MNVIENIVSNSLVETIEFAKNLSKKYLVQGKKIAVEGSLGAGKTFFAKYFFEDLLSENEVVKSPSFTIMNEYHTKDNVELYHLDLYRVSIIDELYGTGFIDIIQDTRSIMFIEWYKNIDLSDYYDKNWMFIEIKILNDLKREIIVREYI